MPQGIQKPYYLSLRPVSHGEKFPKGTSPAVLFLAPQSLKQVLLTVPLKLHEKLHEGNYGHTFSLPLPLEIEKQP